MQSFNNICYQIAKTNGSDEMSSFVNGNNPSKPPAYPTMATGTLAFLVKNESWILKVINNKKPEVVFSKYLDTLNKLIADPHFNLIPMAVGDNIQFFQEVGIQLNELLCYDIRLCAPPIVID